MRLPSLVKRHLSYKIVENFFIETYLLAIILIKAPSNNLIWINTQWFIWTVRDTIIKNIISNILGVSVFWFTWSLIVTQYYSTTSISWNCWIRIAWNKYFSAIWVCAIAILTCLTSTGIWWKNLSSVSPTTGGLQFASY